MSFAALKKHAASLPCDAKALPLGDLKALVDRSHALVLAKLPKKLQKELTP